MGNLSGLASGSAYCQPTIPGDAIMMVKTPTITGMSVLRLGGALFLIILSSHLFAVRPSTLYSRIEWKPDHIPAISSNGGLAAEITLLRVTNTSGHRNTDHEVCHLFVPGGSQRLDCNLGMEMGRAGYLHTSEYGSAVYSNTVAGLCNTL